MSGIRTSTLSLAVSIDTEHVRMSRWYFGSDSRDSKLGELCLLN